MPGPNDHHMRKNTDGNSTLEPGLGRDEPSDAMMDGLRAGSAARMAKMQEELSVQTAELTESQKKHEQELLALAREKAKLKAEREAFERERAKVTGGGKVASGSKAVLSAASPPATAETSEKVGDAPAKPDVVE